MSDNLEQIEIELHNIDEIVDIKNNPVVESVLMPVIKSVPIIGDMIDSSMNRVIQDFQQRKEQELIDIILKDSNIITSDMVNNVEFIVNYNRTLEAVRRLATNDKVRFFGNLIRNGYLSGEHIACSEFEEYLDILNTLSYREIQCLVDYMIYCEARSKNKKVQYNAWAYFRRDYAKKMQISESELWSVFTRIKRTGFIEEEFETESGDVDKEDNSFDSLQVESSGYCLDNSFFRFYEMVLKQDE